ncbi:helix-turn-helix domain-containing protein [Nocardioides mesophilus]|uniref:Helix-turn-helix domain-containing protein n=1 Tax=Nocardioides mesophilus TaxID=433659 RepID=A0A7G9RG56_9ACTN|nr:helix-turn-helix domain-containing protein [Nocardioides mesophilus]QNN54581.1 helix-turn-helix domain-containing protein [Nocardioides mesophilus]
MSAGILLGDLTPTVPGVQDGSGADRSGAVTDAWVLGLQVWDPSAPLAEGHLVAITLPPPGDSAVLRACSAAGCAAVLLRAPDDERDRQPVARLCEELGLGLLWLAAGQPWWPTLRALAAALERDGSGASHPDDHPGPDAGPAAPDPPRRGEDLFALADEIAADVGGPVILEDASFRVLAYSAFVGRMDRGRAEAILGRRIPEQWLEHLASTGSLERLRSGRDVVDLAAGPWQARRRLITAIRAGNRQLGVVWVAEGDRPLPADAPVSLRRAADGAASQLLRHLEQVEAETDRRERQVRALLDGRAPAVAAAAELGLSRSAAFAVLAIRSGGTVLPEDETLRRLLDHVTLCAEAFRHPAALTRLGRNVLAVVGLPAGTEDRTPVRLLHEVVRLAGAGPLAPLQAAVSPVGIGLGSLPRLRDQAVGALAVLDVRAGARAVRFEEVEARVLVRDVVGRLDAGTGLSGLDRLRDRDARAGGDLVRTLRTYLGACGSTSRAAAALGIHVTTLRHRLSRIEEVSGLALDEPEVRVACELVLRRDDA